MTFVYSDFGLICLIRCLNMYFSINADENHLQQAVEICGGNKPKCLRVGSMVFPVIHQKTAIPVIKTLFDFPPVNGVLVFQLV